MHHDAISNHEQDSMMYSLLAQTPPQNRRYALAVLLGLIGGLFSAIVKFGWEVPFPPRTPERNATNPPQTLLEQLGMSPDAAHTMVVFNGNELPIYSFIIHFSFSIAFALIYCLVAERYTAITLWQGAAFGLAVWVVFHLILMPAMGTIPAPWDQPWQEWASEAGGHVIWMWSIELVRRDLRNRITHEPDPQPAVSSDAAGVSVS